MRLLAYVMQAALTKRRSCGCRLSIHCTLIHQTGTEGMQLFRMFARDQESGNLYEDDCLRFRHYMHCAGDQSCELHAMRNLCMYPSLRYSKSARTSLYQELLYLGGQMPAWHLPLNALMQFHSPANRIMPRWPHTCKSTHPSLYLGRCWSAGYTVWCILHQWDL